MFRLWYLTFLGETRSHDVHAHESPWSMAGPLVILALLSIGGGWIGMERFGAFVAPATGARAADAGNGSLELMLSGLAVAAALLGWWIAHIFYKQKPQRPAELAAALSGRIHAAGQQILCGRVLWGDCCEAADGHFDLVLGWVVDTAVIGGVAWLLGGLATFAGALLQRWQSGNIRSYAAWVAAGAAALLLFCDRTLDFGSGESRNSSGYGGALRMNAINDSILTLILLVPLGGAVLVALLPERGRLPNWVALLTVLVNFGLALHLPFITTWCAADFNFRSTSRGLKTLPLRTTWEWTDSACGWWFLWDCWLRWACWRAGMRSRRGARFTLCCF